MEFVMCAGFGHLGAQQQFCGDNCEGVSPSSTFIDFLSNV